MENKDCLTAHASIADEFSQHENRNDGFQIANSLCDGLSNLRNLLFKRIHEDVEQEFGLDSMLAPVSLQKGETQAKLEIEVLQIAEAAEHVQTHRLISSGEWFCDWLGRMRLGDNYASEHVTHRLKTYRVMTADQRRLQFSSVLARVYPEASRAPLVLYRLFPLSVGIVTAIAFRQPLMAAQLRMQQVRWLPAIADCRQCHGQPLDNGELCDPCGNPVWTHPWLNAVD